MSASIKSDSTLSCTKGFIRGEPVASPSFSSSTWVGTGCGAPDAVDIVVVAVAAVAGEVTLLPETRSAREAYIV